MFNNDRILNDFQLEPINRDNLDLKPELEVN
jgi:hypothetical protein